MGFQRYWESGKGADMSVICRGETFRCHSAIICSRSSFFEAAFFGKFEEGLTKTINLSADSLPMVRRMLRYFYVLDYDNYEDGDNAIDVTLSDGSDESVGASESEGASPAAQNDNDELSNLNMDGWPEVCKDRHTRYLFRLFIIHLQMTKMADKYDITCLRDLAVTKFQSRCKLHTGPHCSPSEFRVLLPLVPILYEPKLATDDLEYGLRPTLVTAIAENISLKMELLDDPSFKESLQCAGFAFDVMKSVTRVAYGKIGDIEW
ncbi:MAG: hypothetical protein Q9213_005255 [Squamulea squamosa]